MSAPLPPPPPGSLNDEAAQVVLPPPPSGGPEHDAPPPDVVAPGEVHEADVLKRRKKFSWKAFGGDGFMVSVAVHVLLAILGIFYVISKYQEPAKKPDADVFATGAGGGAKGDKAKAFEHKLKNRNTQVKLPSRIVSKTSNSAVALPATPTTSTAAFATGLASGGMSKGSGGGSGGGEGTGVGIGKGGGRNFVSLFGAKGLNAAGLPGTFYDLKQFADGTPSPMEKDSKAYEEFMRSFFKSWDADKLAKYFKSDQPMSAERIFVPLINDTAAPAAFEVGDKVKAGRWLVIYQGKVTAPFTGKMRFWGIGDDMMLVNWNGKNVLDSGYYLATVPAPGNGRGYSKPVLGSDISIEKGVHNLAKVPFRGSVWLDVVKGRDYPIKIAIGEIYGGKSSYHLLWEKLAEGKKDEGDGRMQVFQMSGEDMPESSLATVQHRGTSFKFGGADLNVVVESPVWKAKGEHRRVR